MPEVHTRIDDERRKLLNSLSGDNDREKLEVLIDEHFMRKANIPNGAEVEIIDHTKEAVQCPQGTLVKNDMVYCDSPEKTNLQRNRLIPREACQNCYERRNNERTQKQKIIQELKELNYVWWKCNAQEYDDIRKQYSEGTDIETLPCIRNIDFDCTPFLQKSRARIDARQHDAYLVDFLKHWEKCPLMDKEKRKLFAFQSALT